METEIFLKIKVTAVFSCLIVAPAPSGSDNSLKEALFLQSFSASPACPRHSSHCVHLQGDYQKGLLPLMLVEGVTGGFGATEMEAYGLLRSVRVNHSSN